MISLIDKHLIQYSGSIFDTQKKSFKTPPDDSFTINNSIPQKPKNVNRKSAENPPSKQLFSVTKTHRRAISPFTDDSRTKRRNDNFLSQAHTGEKSPILPDDAKKPEETPQKASSGQKHIFLRGVTLPS
jgi:hypothetical protein